MINPEPFISADEAAKFLSISRRHLLTLARRGLPGAYPVGTGTRRIWVFRRSRLAAAITKNPDHSNAPLGYDADQPSVLVTEKETI